MLTLPKRYRLFHHQTSQRIRVTPSYRFWRAFNLSLTVWLFTRVLNHLGMFLSNFAYPFWRFDYFAAYGYYFPREYNLILAIIIGNALLFGIFSQALLFYSSPDCLAWQLINDLVLVNFDIYLACTASKGSIKAKRCKNTENIAFLERINIFVKLKRFFKQWWLLENVNLNQMMATSLKFLPNLNLNSRIWLCLTLDGIELYYPLFILIYSKLKIGFYLIGNCL